MDDQITSRQAAEIAGTTISTINRWVESGKLTPTVVLPGYRGARLFARKDVEELSEKAS